MASALVKKTSFRRQSDVPGLTLSLRVEGYVFDV